MVAVYGHMTVTVGGVVQWETKFEKVTDRKVKIITLSVFKFTQYLNLRT